MWPIKAYCFAPPGVVSLDLSVSKYKDMIISFMYQVELLTSLATMMTSFQEVHLGPWKQSKIPFYS